MNLAPDDLSPAERAAERAIRTAELLARAARRSEDMWRRLDAARGVRA